MFVIVALGWDRGWLRQQIFFLKKARNVAGVTQIINDSLTTLFPRVNLFNFDKYFLINRVKSSVFGQKFVFAYQKLWNFHLLCKKVFFFVLKSTKTFKYFSLHSIFSFSLFSVYGIFRLIQWDSKLWPAIIVSDKHWVAPFYHAPQIPYSKTNRSIKKHF